MTKSNRLLWIASLIFFVFLPPALAVEEIPQALHQVLEEAQTRMEAGDYREAARLLDDFQENQKFQHYLLDFIRGNAYLGLGQVSRAKGLYLAAIQKKPDFSPAHQNLARCYFESGDMTLAASSFESAYTLSGGKEPDLLFYAASCLSSADNFLGSLALFEKLMAAHKSQTKLEWKEGMAQAMLGAGLNRKALPLLEEIAGEATGARKRQWQEVLLYQYAELGMGEKAIAYVHGLLDEYPSEPLWWKSLWRLHLNQGQHKEALAALIAYSFFQPLTVEEAELAGDLYAVSGAPTKAASFYEQALANQQDPDMVLKLVDNFRRMRKPQQALEWIDKAMTQGQEKAFTMPRAYVLYDMEEYAQAALAFEKAAPQAREPGQAWLMAGYSAYNAQNLTEARKFLKIAAKYKNTQQAATRLLGQIQPMEDS
ncbi:MAG: tetratricopeptide repeat protein [Desulfatibacillum sp.]|nr:tetratricopeptide repeat protein [Desulfatibacillum sp.]